SNGKCQMPSRNYQHLINLDVGNSAQVHGAFLVYLDFAELSRVGGGCSELRLVSPEGREKDGKPRRCPHYLNTESVLVRGSTMLLCVLASDSSLVYQTMCDGLLTPVLTVGIQDQGRRQHCKRRQQE
uniref:Uncharacterized protein n=1 Tax=Salmo trutta TaxID=8032 RepID=A0A674C6R4_SALTR